jgi:hypothetical protein
MLVFDKHCGGCPKRFVLLRVSATLAPVQASLQHRVRYHA